MRIATKTKAIFSFLFGMIILSVSILSRALAADISHIGTNQRVLVICVTWGDQATTRLTNCSDWATLLQNEVNLFYNQSTFGQTTFQFDAPSGAPNNGWLTLGYNSTNYDFFKTGQDAINLADPYVDFSQYHRVAVITNHTGFGGQGGHGWWWKTTEGKEQTFVENGNSVDKRFMSLSIINEWIDEHAYGLPFDTGGSVLAHELGHHLDLRTHYPEPNVYVSPSGDIRDLLTPWDIMGRSPGMNHFLGWAKFEREWITSAGVQRVDPPTTADRDVTIALSPNETAGGTQLIEVPITSIDPNNPIFTGYAIENRQRINGDENLPSSGVLVSFIDENPNTILKAIVLDDPDTPGDLNQATLEVGDTYSDNARNLSISYESQNGNNANVRVQYKLPPIEPPNPQISPWGAPPWETSDIWVDSEKNGWGTYKYTDSSGAPTGNGDDAWVNHNNRVYFRIKNSGLGVASNVRVEVYANSPPGMGDRGADWTYLGTAVFPNITGKGSEVGYVNWTPTVGEHTCLKVVIIASDNEITTLDNLSQENVVAFDTSANSPYRARCNKFNVYNPFDNRATPIHFLMRDLPQGWKVQIEPTKLTLPPGGSDQVCVTIFPSDVNAEYKPGYIGKPKLEAQIPYADTFVPIGGIDVWTHLTKSSRLTCDLKNNGRQSTSIKSQNPINALSFGLAPKPGKVSAPYPSKHPSTLKDFEKFFAQSSVVNTEPKPTKVSQGELINAKGHLEPGFSGAVIAVDFIMENQIVTQLTNTDANGLWSATYDPSSSGTWEVKAYYAGDSIHAAAESNRCRFDVERTSIEPRVCGFDSGTVRVVHWVAAFLLISVFVLFTVAHRKRVCWLFLVAALIPFLLAFLASLLCWQPHIKHSVILGTFGFGILAFWYRSCKAKKQVETREEIVIR